VALRESPKTLRAHIASLEVFRAAYENYLSSGPGDEQAKAAVIRTVPAAQRAFDSADLNLTVADPPMLGPHRQTYVGLQNVVFLHERPGFRSTGFSGEPGIADAVLETTDQATAVLHDEILLETKRRKNPLYWIDRVARLAISIPTYLVSLIIGESVVSIGRSAWGIPLRVVGIVADLLAIFFGGRAFGIW
jgi:hypothetical protein